MKKLLPFLSFAFLFAACGTTEQKPAGVVQQQIVLDTAGLSAYQAWKAQNELTEAKQFEDAQMEVVTPVRKAAVKRAMAPAPVRKKSTATVTPSTPAQSSDDNTVADNGSGTINNEASQPAKAEEKKGVSKAAKGAVIGGVAGAAGGAVINKKNRVVGAVIGAVIGAGGGYVIGKKMDKKDGRIEYVPIPQ